MKMPKLKPDTPLERLWNGIVKENPTFVLMLGMCPTLAVTTGAINGLGMGLSTAAVLILSNMMISFLRHVIPDGVRMPAYIVIVASFVTVVELLMHAFVTDLYVGYLYTAYRGQLYHFGACRSVRLQARRAGVRL